MRAPVLFIIALALTASAAEAAPRGLRIEITDGWASPKAWQAFGVEPPAAAARPLARPATPAPQAVPPARLAAASEGPWVVQVGAFRGEDQARQALALSASHGGLGGRRPLVQAAGGFFRARFAGFSSRETARAACARLDAGRLPCLVVPPAEAL